MAKVRIPKNGLLTAVQRAYLFEKLTPIQKAYLMAKLADPMISNADAARAARPNEPNEKKLDNWCYRVSRSETINRLIADHRERWGKKQTDRGEEILQRMFDIFMGDPKAMAKQYKDYGGIKFRDAVKCGELAGKAIGIFKDEVEHTVSDEMADLMKSVMGDTGPAGS